MNAEEDSSSLGDVKEYFNKKVSLLNECLALKDLDPQCQSVFRNFENSVIDLRNVFQEIKNEIKRGQNQLTEMKDLLMKMECLNGRLVHVQQNFPSVLKRQPEAPVKKEKTTAAATPVISKKAKEPDQIKYLTVTEFDSVPKYMKDRLQYTQINSFIDDFNKVIIAKYTFLSKPRKLLKASDYKTRNIMKLEENDETKGLYFCTSENLKDYANIKKDKTTDKFLTILRHCKRLKEVRGPGSLKRYVIIP